MLEIFGWDNIQFGYDVCDSDYRVIAVHLEWNLIFLVGEDKKLIAYDMNLRKVLSSLSRLCGIIDLPRGYVQRDITIFLMFPCSWSQ